MVSVVELGTKVSAEMSAPVAFYKDEHCTRQILCSDARSGQFSCVVLEESRGSVRWARLSQFDFSVDVCFSRKFLTRGGDREFHAPHASIQNGSIDFADSAVWKNHPDIARALDQGFNQIVAESWRGSLSLSTTLTDSAEAPGLRTPQMGALHAISAHWTVKNGAAKVVLPTGTGKTEVMIAASLLSRELRTLVLVPSDALRTQVAEKYKKLGILREIGAVSPGAMNPVVGKLLRAPQDIESVHSLRASNVVVTTTQMLLGMDDQTLEEFLGWFGLVMFDEAHHVPAASWMRIQTRTERRAKKLLLTATPYRNDGKRVSGELIYQFPLRLAQAQGYFERISVTKVDEGDGRLADEAIARAAVEALRRDDARGYTHLILAKARSIEHANLLFSLYESSYPELNPVALHTGVGVVARREAITGLRAFSHRVVVCVDMLGEGFDLPNLKIAAMHDLHRSLPITLQFIGRFTRAAQHVGGATVVFNVAEPMALTAVAELFSEDADWNELIPELSAHAVKSEIDLEEFVSRMRAASSSEECIFDLALLHPKAAVSIYKASEFLPERFAGGLTRSSKIHQSWISDERDVLIFITKEQTYPDWSITKDATGFEWGLCLLAHDSENNLIYTHSTSSAVNVSRVVRAVSNENSTLVSGEKMFRVFDGLHRAVFYNVGLYRRGNVRFQMLVGMDIGDHVSTAIQAGSAKSNIFANGFAEGKQVSIGASFKGRIWTMANLSIPDWIEWAKKLAAKVVNDQIATDTILRYALIPREVARRPDTPVFACLPPLELIPGDYVGDRKISVDGDAAAYSQADINFEVSSFEEDSVTIALAVGEHASSYRLTWAGGFAVRHIDGPDIRLLIQANSIRMDEFLGEHAPALLLNDGSELVGKFHFVHPTPYPYVFSPDSIRPIDWGSTPIRKESKWRSGRQRENSVQGHLIDMLVSKDGLIVFDDDDPGEAADVIALTENTETMEIVATLYHCKYSAGDAPGARVKDLYEVCGQAVKSSRLLHRLDGLLGHIERREGVLRGRPTRFEKGGLSDIKRLRRKFHQYRLRLDICVVQPGLSAGRLTPELSSILAAADGFVLEFTGKTLKVLGSH